MKKQKKRAFCITRVVTLNELRDFGNSVRNMFGLRLRSYEKKIQENIKEMYRELEKDGDIEEFRLNINELGNRSIMLTISGWYACSKR